jgi:cell division protein FtsA
MRKAGLRTGGVVLQSLASATVLSEREKELGVVLIDIGGGTSDIAIFQNGSLQTISEINMGGDIITQDIARMLHCSRPDAENLKKKFGHANPMEVDADEKIELRSPAPGRRRALHSRRELAEIIEARLEEILLSVQKEIHRSGMGERIYGGVVLTGGTALLEGIEDVAERIFGYPCRVGRPQGLLGMGEVVSTPIYATAVGLVRWAADRGAAAREPWYVRFFKWLMDIFG